MYGTINIKYKELNLLSILKFKNLIALKELNS
jgi:hypothetical protein